jgi:hypothetical protein
MSIFYILNLLHTFKTIAHFETISTTISDVCNKQSFGIYKSRLKEARLAAKATLILQTIPNIAPWTILGHLYVTKGFRL